MERESKEGKHKTPRSPVLDTRPEYERLGRWIRDQRKQTGNLQQPVADVIRKPRQFLTKVESGQQRIDVVEFIDLFRALGLDSSLTIAQLIEVLSGQT